MLTSWRCNLMWTVLCYIEEPISNCLREEVNAWRLAYSERLLQENSGFRRYLHNYELNSTIWKQIPCVLINLSIEHLEGIQNNCLWNSWTFSAKLSRSKQSLNRHVFRASRRLARKTIEKRCFKHRLELEKASIKANGCENVPRHCHERRHKFLFRGKGTCWSAECVRVPGGTWC